MRAIAFERTRLSPSVVALIVRDSRVLNGRITKSVRKCWCGTRAKARHLCMKHYLRWYFKQRSGVSAVGMSASEARADVLTAAPPRAQSARTVVQGARSRTDGDVGSSPSLSALTAQNVVAAARLDDVQASWNRATYQGASQTTGIDREPADSERKHCGADVEPSATGCGNEGYERGQDSPATNNAQSRTASA